MADDDNFSNLLGDEAITPLKRKESRVEVKVAPKLDTLALERRRQAAASRDEVPADPLGGEPPVILEPFDELSFKRPGVQNGVFRNLRLGKYKMDARLDLHRMKVDQARREVYQFIRDCVIHDVRVALITHGKGEGREQPARLKSYVGFWLPQMEEVLAFHTAMKHHGGYGATYVLVRKSEHKKLENREKHSRRG